MRSMTGTGSASADGERGRVTVQVSAVNHRGCRVMVRGDLRDLALEDRLRRRVQERLERGSINVHVQLEAASSTGIDRERLLAAYRELAELAQAAGAPQPALTDALRFAAPAAEADVSPWQAPVERALEEALAACEAMRAREGAALGEAFAAHHGELFEIKARLAELAEARPQQYAERLYQRLAEVLAERSELTPDHLVRELAIYADRIDVTEELVRLDSHLAQLGELLGSADAVGKRLEFLLQEIGREINTTGAKANDATLQATVIDAKQVVESMKEQAANVL